MLEVILGAVILIIIASVAGIAVYKGITIAYAQTKHERQQKVARNNIAKEEERHLQWITHKDVDEDAYF